MYRQFLNPKKSLFFALFLLHQSAFATSTLDLTSALDSAMQNSPTLQKAEAQKQAAQWKNVEGFSVFLPTISLSGNHFFEKKYQVLDINLGGGPLQIPQIFPTSSASLSARWVLFDGLSNVNTFRASNRYSEAAKQDYAWSRFALEQEVVLAYYKVVAAKKLERVAEENVKTLDTHLKQIQDLKKGGLATHYDVLRVESQKSEAEAELLQAKDNIQLAQEKLGQVLGSKEAIDVSDQDLATPEETKVSTLDYHQENNKRLDLLALENRVEASDLIDSAQSRFWIPKVGMMADYTKYNNRTDPLSDWKNYRPAWNVGFFMSWDLFNPRVFAQAKQESYQALGNQKSLVQASLQAPVDFSFWKKRYLYSTKLFQAKSADLIRATETVRLAQAGFKAGVRTTTEVLDAELDLFRARAGIVNAQMNATEAKVKLELALGEKI